MQVVPFKFGWGMLREKVSIEVSKENKSIKAVANFPFIRFRCERGEKYYSLQFYIGELSYYSIPLLYKHFGRKSNYPETVLTLEVDKENRSALLMYRPCQ